MEYGDEYYEMVLVYVDDLFVISHEQAMKYIFRSKARLSCF